LAERVPNDASTSPKSPTQRPRERAADHVSKDWLARWLGFGSAK
jgi:hypothetical protein